MFILSAVGGFLFCCAAWLFRGPFTIRPAQRTVTIAASAERLEQSVRFLTESVSPRDYRHTENLDRAASWIAEQMRASDLETTLQSYELREGTFLNVVGLRPGSEGSGGALVIGAHYDAYLASPGADDNASGVAVLLELARWIGSQRTGIPVYFVAFSTEEPPFFATEDMGSHRFARLLVDEGQEVRFMISLDLVGYYDDERSSQSWPISWMGLLYPDRGNYLVVAGDFGTSAQLLEMKRGFNQNRALPLYSVRAPRFLGWADLSDNRSFRQLGMPAVLLTDTAMLRNPHYHRREDLPGTLDYDRMAGVVAGLAGVVRELDDQIAPERDP